MTNERNPSITLSDIVAYFDGCESDYGRFWKVDRYLAMHLGYWDSAARTFPAALIRQNEVLAEIAGINSSDVVLDAGCGVGGSAIFLAQRVQCRVVGITISDRQETLARENARKAGVEDRVCFYNMDFCNTTFADESFDVVWALESMCYALSKQAFVEEAYRLLKPGGKLILADGFVFKEDMPPIEAERLRKVLHGWAVDQLEKLSEFRRFLRERNFIDIYEQDITDNVKPSTRRLYLLAAPGMLLTRLYQLLGRRTALQTRNVDSAFHQYKFNKSSCKYVIFYARKG